MGRHSDGDGLILNVYKTGLRQWNLRVQVDGKRREFTLGTYPDLSLSDARTRAKEWRDAFKRGDDPRRERRQTPTFKDLATDYIKLNAPSWTNDKHAEQWTSTLTTYAFPTLGDMRVDKITAGHILDVLEPIWNDKRETASRVKQRIQAVLQYAVAREYREYAPNVTKAMPSRGKKPTHHAAMPYDQVPAFLADLRYSPSDMMVKLALEFTVLTAARSGEVRKAEWGEIQGDVWVIPPERMKARREHRVPLSKQALSVLERARQWQDGEIIFHGRKRWLSDMTMLQIMRRMPAWKDYTVHGFRSSFHGWASNARFDHNLIELCLAHTVGDATVQAYHRDDLLALRREIMQGWADHCLP